MLKKNNTFCYLLWERAYIDECGDVFCCCLEKPGPLGNIYKHDLAYIWQKSKNAKLFRKMSLDGDLNCYANCTVLAKKDKGISLGRFYRSQGKPVKAERTFKDDLKINPKDHEIHAELGWLYKDLNRFNKAEASFKKALELEPNSKYACIGLGWLYKDLGRLNEAEALFKKTLELEPNNKSARLGLDKIYTDQRSFKQAKKVLRKRAKFSLNTDYPRTLQIMAGTFCTLNCVMCVQDHSSKAVLKSDILKRNIDWTRINDILMMGGEVLAIKSAKELYIWLTKKMQKRIKLTTNGLLINREWAERLVKGSEWIEVSVNAATKKTHESVNKGSRFERVIRNLKMLIDLRRSYSTKTEIKYHFTITPENIQEIARAIMFADRLGCDLITYSFDSPNVEIFLSKHKDIEKRIKEDLLKVISNNLKIKIQRNHLEQLGLIKGSNPKLVDEY